MESSKCVDGTKRLQLISLSWFNLEHCTFKKKWPQLITGGGHRAAKHMGEHRLELARLSKLCRGVPIKPYLAAKRRLFFGLQLRLWLWGRGAPSLISCINVICVFTAQRGLSQASTLNPALHTSVCLQTATSKGGVGVCGRQCVFVWLPERMCGWESEALRICTVKDAAVQRD